MTDSENRKIVATFARQLQLIAADSRFDVDATVKQLRGIADLLERKVIEPTRLMGSVEIGAVRV